MNADNEEPTLTKGAEKVGGVIPEIFFDVIARVIPGSVFLLAYCLTYRLPVSPILDPDAVRPIEFLTVFLYIAPFFVAYSIGLFAHLTSRLILSNMVYFGLFFPVLWLRFKFCDNNRSEYKEANNKKTKKYKEYVDKSWYVRSRDLLDRFEKLSPSKHNLLKKIMAESGFFRSSVLLCLLLLASPSWFTSLCYTESIIKTEVVIGLAVFLLCLHIECQIHLKKRLAIFEAADFGGRAPFEWLWSAPDGVSDTRPRSPGPRAPSARC